MILHSKRKHFTFAFRSNLDVIQQYKPRKASFVILSDDWQNHKHDIDGTDGRSQGFTNFRLAELFLNVRRESGTSESINQRWDLARISDAGTQSALIFNATDNRIDGTGTRHSAADDFIS